jgi:hypothetical protein
MTRSLACVLAIAALLCLASAPAAAQGFSVTITFNEFGSGLLTNTAGVSLPTPSSIRADPGPGGLPAVLFYDTLNPPGLVGGDVLILEAATGALSDLLRFNPAVLTGGVFVYSDNLDGVDAPADIGLPPAFNTNLVQVVEIGPEGNNGITYTPTAGQPGFVAGAAGPVTYVFQSDMVPEPSSLLLLAAGATVLALRRRSLVRQPRRG